MIIIGLKYSKILIRFIENWDSNNHLQFWWRHFQERKALSLAEKEKKGSVREYETNYVKMYQKFQDKKLKLSKNGVEDLKVARKEGRFHEEMLDRREKMKSDRYCMWRRRGTVDYNIYLYISISGPVSLYLYQMLNFSETIIICNVSNLHDQMPCFITNFKYIVACTFYLLLLLGMFSVFTPFPYLACQLSLPITWYDDITMVITANEYESITETDNESEIKIYIKEGIQKVGSPLL